MDSNNYNPDSGSAPPSTYLPRPSAAEMAVGAANSDPTVRQRLLDEHFGVATEEALDALLVSKHRIKSAAELQDLRDILQGYAIQAGYVHGSRGDFSDRRRNVIKATRGMHGAANQILAQLKCLRDHAGQFDKAMGDIACAPLMEQAFDIPAIDPHALDLPDSLQSLFAPLLRDGGALGSLESTLTELARLPVRRGNAGQFSNDATLIKCLTACRVWMKTVEGWGWTSDDLASARLRRAKDFKAIEGARPSFVIDLLLDAGIDFDLARLNTHWRRIKVA